MIEKIKKYFKEWSMFEKIWLSLFTLINIYLFFAWKDTLIGLITSLTGMFCVVLVAKGKILNYYPGIINVILYAYLAYNQKYYGEVMLNVLYFLPIQFVGLYYWKKNKVKGKVDTVVAEFMSNKFRVIWLFASVVGVIGYGVFLKALNGNLPFVDATSTVLSIIAMILMVKRYMEQWVLWIIVDIVSIGMWLDVFLREGNDISMLIMWSAYLVNAIYGLYNWNRLYNLRNEVKI